MNPESPNFERLVNQHKDAVYRQMLRVCGNHADAEDVLIEALLKAYRHLHQLQHSAAFRAWLAKIASRVCWQLRQREALMPLLQLSELEEQGTEIASTESPIDAQLALAEMKTLLLAAIAGLSPEYRSVYEMRDLQNMPGDEVAQKLKISRAGMKSRLHRARALVRQQLDGVLTRKSAKEEAKLITQS
ncbi:MAG: sigma-70 family RNA polymerase sigma factor [Terriglobales bacterium]